MTVRIGVIGCGQWGMNYVRTFSELQGCDLVMACDLSPDRLHLAERRVPSLRTTSDVSELVGDEDIDAVVIATEASTHFPTVKAALEAGKDVLVEKPMTTDVESAKRLRDLTVEHSRILMVGHIFLYNPAIQHLQQMIASEAIGDLQYVTFTRTNLGPIRSDVNVVWDLMTHDASILLYLLHQNPSWVSAQGACYLRPGCEDVAFATVRFPNGVIANIRASWLDPQKVREITVVGTRKMVVFNDLDLSEPVRVFNKGTVREPNYRNFGEFKLVVRSGDVVIPFIPVSEPLRNQCQHFIECVSTRRQPVSDAGSGVRVVELLTGINRSIRDNGVPDGHSREATQV